MFFLPNETSTNCTRYLFDIKERSTVLQLVCIFLVIIGEKKSRP
jgi:hypothetical protein